jgi:heme/copper-type cytochrome/quinol oxidase subunit 4
MPGWPLSVLSGEGICCHRAHYSSTQVYRSQLVPFILYVRVTIIAIVAVAVDTVAVVVPVVILLVRL